MIRKYNFLLCLLIYSASAICAVYADGHVQFLNRDILVTKETNDVCLCFYPNPVKLGVNNGGTLYFFDGDIHPPYDHMKSVKIIDEAGEEIISFKIEGADQLFWNGKDKNSNYVEIGVYYFIVETLYSGTMIRTVAVVR